MHADPIVMGAGDSIINIYEVGSHVSIVGGVRGPAFMLFLFYVNVSWMWPGSCLSSQPLTIQGSWVILCIWWSIPMVPSLVAASHFLPGNMEAQLKPTTFSSLPLSVFLSLSFSPLWDLKVRSSFSGLCPTQTPTIHSYHALFSLLLQQSSLFLSSSHHWINPSLRWPNF